MWWLWPWRPAVADRPSSLHDHLCTNNINKIWLCHVQTTKTYSRPGGTVYVSPDLVALYMCLQTWWHCICDNACTDWDSLTKKGKWKWKMVFPCSYHSFNCKVIACDVFCLLKYFSFSYTTSAGSLPIDETLASKPHHVFRGERLINNTD